MFAGQRSQWKLEVPTVVESLVQKSVQLTCSRSLQSEVLVQVESLEIAHLAAGEDRFAPGKRRKPIFGGISSTVQAEGFEDVEGLILPALSGAVPPCLSVLQGDAGPALQGFVESAIRGTTGIPAEELHQFVASELDSPSLKGIPQTGQVQQCQQHIGVGWSGQAVQRTAGDDE